MSNNWLYLILSSAFYETDFLISSIILTIVSSIAAIFITLIFCVKRRTPTLISKGTNTMSAPSPGQPGTPSQKQKDGKNPTKGAAGNGKPTNDGKNGGKSLAADGGNNNPGEKGQHPSTQVTGSIDGSKPTPGGGGKSRNVTAGGFALRTAKGETRKQDLLDETQKSQKSTRKKNKPSAEQTKQKISKTDNMRNGHPVFAPEMDVGSDEETLQNVKSLEKENEHSLQNDAK